MDMGHMELSEIKKQAAQESKGLFLDLLGVNLDRANKDEVIISIEIGDKHLNSNKVVHGGVHASLLDTAMGLLAMLNSGQSKVVTTNLNIHYLSAKSSGKLLSKSHLVHRTKRTLTMESKVVDEQGNLVAFSTGSFRLLTE
jgi:uncharacterized protein (TIGR00369 family)